jgi:murein endopeptidase
MLLPDLPFFYSRIAPGAAYGSKTMVQLIQDAGRHMSWAMPQAAPFAVGDISRPGGGPISGHVSHRGGVDVDIGIYKEGGQQARNQFLKFAPSQLDVAATWELMRFFLDSGKVDFILLDRAHIARIKAWTLQQGLLKASEAERIFPPEGSRETWLHTGIVRHVAHHADHIHVRVLCEDGARAGY